MLKCIANNDDRSILLDRARDELRNRRRRFERFGRPMFGEPAWEMLLTLYTNEEFGTGLPANQIARFSGESLEAASRWLRFLRQKGLVLSRTDQGDNAMPLIELSELARRELDLYFGQS